MQRLRGGREGGRGRQAGSLISKAPEAAHAFRPEHLSQIRPHRRGWAKRGEYVSPFFPLLSSIRWRLSQQCVHDWKTTERVRALPPTGYERETSRVDGHSGYDVFRPSGQAGDISPSQIPTCLVAWNQADGIVRLMFGFVGSGRSLSLNLERTIGCRCGCG